MTYIPHDLRAELVGRGFDPKTFALDLLERELTEARTDKLLDLLMDAITPKLPVWLRFLSGGIRKALDALLPDALVAALRKALA